MQESQVSQYDSALSGAQNDPLAGGNIFPCESILTDLGFLIGDSECATIPGWLLNYETIDSGTTCYDSLQTVFIGFPDIYSDIFFNTYYAVFDFNGPEFDFAPSVQPNLIAPH
jgi:hypothetical protein